LAYLPHSAYIALFGNWINDNQDLLTGVGGHCKPLNADMSSLDIGQTQPNLS